MTVTERTIEYARLNSEDEFKKPGDSKLVNWPQEGKVEFSKVSMRYQEGMDLVLKDMTFTI